MKKITLFVLTSVFMCLISCENNTYDQEITSKNLTSEFKKINKGNIRTLNGKYFCTDSDRSVIANRDISGEWELFFFNWEDNDKLSILSFDDYFLSADLNGEGDVTSTRKEKNEWETFSIEFLENNLVALKASNGKYLSVDSLTFKLRASAEKVGENEKFSLIEVNN